VGFISYRENIDTATPQGEMIFTQHGLYGFSGEHTGWVG
jgi:hypothetical protein